MTDVFTRLKELWDATTKGKWLNGYPNAGKLEPMPGHIWSSEKKLIAIDLLSDDASFIAFAHNSVPAMLAEVERLQHLLNVSWTRDAVANLEKENTELKQRIEKLERALAVFFGRLQVITDSSLYDLERRRARSLIEQANQILEDGK